MGKLIYDGVVYAGGVVVDSALSTTSTNPVQNKVVAEAVNTINTHLTPEMINVTRGTNLASGNVRVYKTGKLVNVIFSDVVLNATGQVNIANGLPAPRAQAQGVLAYGTAIEGTCYVTSVGDLQGNVTIPAGRMMATTFSYVCY